MLFHVEPGTTLQIRNPTFAGLVALEAWGTRSCMFGAIATKHFSMNGLPGSRPAATAWVEQPHRRPVLLTLTTTTLKTNQSIDFLGNRQRSFQESSCACPPNCPQVTRPCMEWCRTCDPPLPKSSSNIDHAVEDKRLTSLLRSTGDFDQPGSFVASRPTWRFWSCEQRVWEQDRKP